MCWVLRCTGARCSGAIRLAAAACRTSGRSAGGALHLRDHRARGSCRCRRRGDRQRHDCVSRRRHRAVGAYVTVPAGAQVIAGKGLTVYPGLIDMGSTAGLDVPAIPRAREPADHRGHRARQARHAAARRSCARPITEPVGAGADARGAGGHHVILATPASDGIRGQSALVNTALGADVPQIGALADERRGAWSSARRWRCT